MDNLAPSGIDSKEPCLGTCFNLLTEAEQLHSFTAGDSLQAHQAANNVTAAVNIQAEETRPDSPVWSKKEAWNVKTHDMVAELPVICSHTAQDLWPE
ncbi:hypothetical protein P7K49_026475 [Saguinus oedipus]|uniref:Uncharacterized protein n=1 Tax=Saguinus oedipus TaxID=9490 RepID=A0ABQ9UDC3_SAGOE|nr:hypothetical protein P7K49_026475 [Saguinus oedipus]